MHIPPRSQGSLKAIAKKSALAREVILPVQQFIYTEGLSGIVLFIATVVALIWANSPWAENYHSLWKEYLTIDIGFFHVEKPLSLWINDGLMALFFFVVGLEVKREILHGQLADMRRASLPLLAGIGGMVVPALFYVVFNADGPGQAGWGIPMATDIAFALGVLTLLGSRVPMELRIFLLAFAIVDDLGAILVIAIFYTEQLALAPLAWSALLIGMLFALNRAKVNQITLYIFIGILLWEMVLESGIHPTLAGVVVAMFIPAKSYFNRETFFKSMEILLRQFKEAMDNKQKNREEAILGRIEKLSRDTETPLERLERVLHPWTGYLVLPLFALANAGIPLSLDAINAAIANPVTWGILSGLIVGKPIGIVTFSWLAVKLNWAVLPNGANWRQITGIGLLAGIGFTVSLFIAGLSFGDEAMNTQAKFGILLASVIAGALGSLLLIARGKKKNGEAA